MSFRTCAEREKVRHQEKSKKFTTAFDLNIFYFIYMKRDWAEHRCYVKALS